MKSATLLAVLHLSAGLSLAADWPNWRGPHHDGISREADWTATWEGEPKLRWKATVGSGFSSVTVADGRAFTFGLTPDKKETIHCLDARSGQLLWTHAWPSEFKPKYYEGGTSSTPTVEGAHVFVLGQSGQLACLTAAAGKVVWEKDLAQETGAAAGTWGFTGSPLVLGSRVIVSVGRHGTAVDQKTGAMLWQSGKEEAGYATPVPFTHGSKPLLAIMGANAVFAVDPATGTAAWQHEWKTRYDVNAADPLVSGDRMLISSGYGRGAGLLNFAASPPKLEWENTNLRSQMNPGVLVAGSVYGFDGNADEKASLVCLDFATGAVRWREPLGYGSLLAAAGKLIILTEKGELLTAEASPTGFKPLARAQVIAGKCWTVPTLANGSLFVRNWKGEVRCFSVGK